MLMEKRLSAQQANQDGFASLVIAIVLVLVLSLITVGFAELMRHEERSALDRQLSSQAYYAAESGINDATQAINQGYLAGKDQCGVGKGLDTTSNPAYPAIISGSLSNNLVAVDASHNPTNASYPCLLINPHPPDLHYDSVATTTSRTIEFTALDSSNLPTSITKLKLSWQNEKGTSVDDTGNSVFVSGCLNNFKSEAGWGTATGVLRAQLIPLTSTGLDRTALEANSMTAFLCPNNGGPATFVDYNVAHGSVDSGQILNGSCSSTPAPALCNVSITGLPSNTSTFFLNMRSIYAPTSVTITAYDASDKVLNLTGAQTLIDSTGKAQDVLRRVQVRLSSTKAYDIPDGTHGDICKQFDLAPLSTTSNGTGCDVTDLLK